MTMIKFITALLLSISLPVQASEFVMKQSLKTPTSANNSKQALSQRSYERLSKIYQLAQQQRYDEALSQLSLLFEQVNSAYEQAVLINTAAYYYLQQTDKEDKAIELYEILLQQQALSANELLNIQTNLAKLYLATEQYSQAIKYFNTYIAVKVDNPKLNLITEDYLYLAQAYQLNNQLQLAAVTYQKANNLADQLQQAIPSQWYQQWLQVNVQLSQFQQALMISKKLLQRDANNVQNYLQTAILYEQLAKNSQALAIYEMAYQQGLLSKQQQFLRLAFMLQQANYPYKAANILTEQIANQRMSEDESVLQTLAQAWFAAKMYKEAEKVYLQLLNKYPKASYSQQLQFIYMQNNDLPAVIKLIAEKADKQGEDYTLIAYLHYQLGNIELSREHFLQALQFDQSKQQAEDWLIYLAAQQEQQ